MNALAFNFPLRVSLGRCRLPLALLAALATPLAGCAAGAAGSGAAAGGTAGGYVLSPADRAVIAALPAPRPAGIDLSGACRNTEPVFEDARAKAQWTAPSYGLPLRLWAISHVGVRAGTSEPPCADIELATRLWQSAIGSPITGRWSERDVTEFVRIVDAHDPRYAQAGQRRRAVASEVAAGQGSGMARETLGQRPTSGRAVAVESPSAGSRRAEGSVEGKVSQVQLENTLTLFGSSYDKVSQQLSGVLCKPQGQTILCVKEDPCFNFQTLHDTGGRTGTRLRGGGSPHGPQSAEELGQGLMEMLNHMDPRVRQAQQADNATKLAACRARYRASPEASVELGFAGQPVKKAILSFEGGRYSRLEIDNRGSNVEESQKFGEYCNAINRWLTRRLGEPRVTQITNTERWVDTQCYGLSCTSMPFDKVYQHHEYIWRTSSVRAHQEGNVFDIDSMR